MTSDKPGDRDSVKPAAKAGEVDGLLNLDDFSDATGLELPPGPYNTAAGYLMARLGKLPAEGDTVIVQGRTLTVASMDSRRVARIKVGSVVSAPPVDATAQSVAGE